LFANLAVRSLFALVLLPALPRRARAAFSVLPRRAKRTEDELA
jgi:hypothetical protein